MRAALRRGGWPKVFRDSAVENLREFFDRFRRLTRLLAEARRRAWTGAAGQVRFRLGHALACLREQIETARERVAPVTSAPSHPPLRLIYEELRALHEEFAHVELDLRGHTLSVLTAPIELEDVSLGRFEIRLDWRALGSIRPY